jgi:hypothetical protein
MQTTGPGFKIGVNSFEAKKTFFKEGAFRER